MGDPTVSHPYDPASRRTARRRDGGYALLALAWALVDLRLIVLLMSKVIVRSADVIEGVVNREPLWRVYQSRVLGPHLVRALSAVGDVTPAVAYAVFMLPILFLAGLALLLSADRLRDPERSPFASLLLFQLCLVLLVPGYWLYAWDLLSLLVFTVFVGLVLHRARRRWFVLLYAVAVLNHEMAFFIAGWLVLDPVVRSLAARRQAGPRPRLDRATVLLGAGLLVAGVALVEGLRSTLMIRETQPGLQLPPEVVYGRSFHFTLLNNLDAIGGCLADNLQNGFPFVVPVFLAFTVFVAVRLARLDRERYGALALVMLGMVGSLLVFGLVYETRVLLPLVPFVALNGWAALRGGPPGAATRR